MSDDPQVDVCISYPDRNGTRQKHFYTGSRELIATLRSWKEQALRDIRLTWGKTDLAVIELIERDLQREGIDYTLPTGEASRVAEMRRCAAASRGEASAEELELLRADGYLIAGGRLVRCPICGHDRFSQRRAVLSGRAAAFWNMQWAGDSAETQTCQSCGHVLWFMR
jgi:hypothetical protein